MMNAPSGPENCHARSIGRQVAKQIAVGSVTESVNGHVQRSIECPSEPGRRRRRSVSSRAEASRGKAPCARLNAFYRNRRRTRGGPISRRDREGSKRHGRNNLSGITATTEATSALRAL